MAIMLLAVVFARLKEDGQCRLQDISNIIGGDKFNVDSIVVRSLVNDCKQDEVWVAGKKTDIVTKESKGFVYIFRPNECLSYEFYEFSGLNQGISEIIQNYKGGRAEKFKLQIENLEQGQLYTAYFALYYKYLEEGGDPAEIPEFIRIF